MVLTYIYIRMGAILVQGQWPFKQTCSISLYFSCKNWAHSGIQETWVLLKLVVVGTRSPGNNTIYHMKNLNKSECDFHSFMTSLFPRKTFKDFICFISAGINPCPVEPGYALPLQTADPDQLASRSQLIWIYTVCHSVCEFVSTTCIK